MKPRFTAEMHMEHYFKKVGIEKKDFTCPKFAVIVWDEYVLMQIFKNNQLKRLPNLGLGMYIYTCIIASKSILVVNLPIGAPIAANTLEELKVLGVRTVIGIGFTGSLQPDINIGKLILPDTCVSEEGTSKHYIESDDNLMVPDKALKDFILSFCASRDIKLFTGKIWTTDAYYREYIEKIEYYRKKGVLCIDMETSAMYAVGKVIGISVCNLLVVSDRVWHDWENDYTCREAFESIKKIGQIIEYIVTK